MNAKLEPFVAGNAGADATIAAANLMAKKLGVLGIATFGIQAVAITAAGGNIPDASEADLINLGADVSSDPLNLYLLDGQGRMHNVGGLLKRFQSKDIVFDIGAVMGEFYGPAASGQMTRAIAGVPGVVDALNKALVS